MSFETDRSGILSWQKCPRDRWYSRHFNGTGIERLKKSLALQFGSAFHEGAECLLNGEGVEPAVEYALAYLNIQFAEAAVDLEEKQTAYTVEEQKAIAEGLIRAWWIAKGERFLDEFEVLEVEQEGRAPLLGRRFKRCKECGTEQTLPAKFCGMCSANIEGLKEINAESIVLMFRPDALVREKLTGDLYIISWKTASTFGQYTLNQIACDMQSMSEVWGVEATYANKE